MNTKYPALKYVRPCAWTINTVFYAYAQTSTMKVHTLGELRMRDSANGWAVCRALAARVATVGYTPIAVASCTCAPLIDGLGHATGSATMSVCRSRTHSFQQNRHFNFLAHVPLKLLVSLISRLVACSARIVVDRHTHRNPRCACAARVTVLGLSVCPSVCPSVCLSVRLLPRFLPPRATNR